MTKLIVIVGAGLSGAVLAERYANLGHEVMIIEKRDHIAGNVYDYVTERGLLMSKYGAHIFHTSDNQVWDYVNRFSVWKNYEHRVLSKVDEQLVPVPVNIDTVNKILKLNIKNPEEMKSWLQDQRHSIKDGTRGDDSRDAALRRIGNVELYEKMFKYYTYKQWNMFPEKLEASVLERIPIRTDYNDRYFSDKHEGIPSLGYTEMVRRMLDHKNIYVMLNTDYFDIKDSLNPDQLFFTGKIDSYFNNTFGKLQYRSLRFEHETLEQKSFQEAAVINYPTMDVKYTRIVEHKKIYNQLDEPYTIITKEYPTDEGEPYYPIPNKKNRDLYDKYKKLTEHNKEATFIGRLANYKYFNMDQAIKNALNIFNELEG